jgi:hypothetical protein
MTQNDLLELEGVNEYVSSIKMVSDIDQKQVKELFFKAKFLCPDKLKSVFISNYRESDGKDQFKDIWFFSDNYVIEALNFTTEKNHKLEISVIKNNIGTVTIESTDFDFLKKAVEGSKLHIVFYTLGIFNCDQIAYGINCDSLMNIFSRFIKNNIVSGRTYIPE